MKPSFFKKNTSAVLKLLNRFIAWFIYSFLLSLLLTAAPLVLLCFFCEFKLNMLPENMLFFGIPLAIIAVSGLFTFWIWRKIQPSGQFSDAEERTLGILAGILGAGTFIVLIGGFDLALSTLRFPEVGFGQSVSEITGCNRFDGVIRFKYYYWFCLWFGLLSPLIICPAAFLLRKRKNLLLAMLLFLPFYSYLEVNIGTQAGFHYRAQLRERFGKDTKGYLAVDRLMPPDVRKEYGWGPRAKTCRVAGVLGWLYWPLWNLLWFPVFLLIAYVLNVLGRFAGKRPPA